MSSSFEVPNPILNSPYEEPREYWDIKPGDPPKAPTPGRRPAFYYYRPPTTRDREQYGGEAGIAIELKLVNLIRKKVAQWRPLALRGEFTSSAKTFRQIALSTSGLMPYADRQLRGRSQVKTQSARANMQIAGYSGSPDMPKT